MEEAVDVEHFEQVPDRYMFAGTSLATLWGHPPIGREIEILYALGERCGSLGLRPPP